MFYFNNYKQPEQVLFLENLFLIHLNKYFVQSVEHIYFKPIVLPDCQIHFHKQKCLTVLNLLIVLLKILILKLMLFNASGFNTLF